MMARRLRQRPSDRALWLFIGLSVAAHILVFISGRLFRTTERAILPAYNVKLVTTVPGGGTRAKAASALGAADARAPQAVEAPKAAEQPKPKPIAKKAEPPPAPKPVAKVPAKPTATKPVPKALSKKTEEKPSGKGDDKKAAKAEKAPDLTSALADVKGMIGKKQRGHEAGAAGGTRTEQVEFGGGEGGAQVGALALQIYVGQVQSAIQSHWAIPGELARMKIVVQLGIRVGADGKINDVWVDKGSGVSSFDESAMRAVRAASPLPVPPQTKNGSFEFYTRFTPQGHEE